LNLKALYEIHHYDAHHVWNANETGAQACRGGGALIIAKKGSRVVHSVIPDDKEWMFVLSCVNAGGRAIPLFYIFWWRRFRRNYISGCKARAAMAM
jgi:hypothetical protein